MMYASPWSRFELTTSVVIGTDCIGCSKFNYHTITATKRLLDGSLFSQKYFSNIARIYYIGRGNHTIPGENTDLPQVNDNLYPLMSLRDNPSFWLSKEKKTFCNQYHTGANYAEKMFESLRKNYSFCYDRTKRIGTITEHFLL